MVFGMVLLPAFRSFSYVAAGNVWFHMGLAVTMSNRREVEAWVPAAKRGPPDVGISKGTG
jgi:hypothetical protein